MSTGEVENARECFINTLAMKPDHKEALNNLGYIFLLETRIDVARKHFQKALAADPDYELAWLNLANVYGMEENKTELIKCLKEVLRINPANREAQQLLKTLTA